MNSVLVESLVLEPLVATDMPAAQGRSVSSDLSLVDHVKVRLTAVLGDVELTVAELFELKAGGVLRLAQGLEEPVVLQLDGKPVATATLVAVGDCFGVQIAQVL
jgi:flagellar motor switch protein FliN/FliY